MLVPLGYRFESKFTDFSGESSVAYTGQIARHLLISELTGYIGGLTDDIDTGAALAAG